MNVPLLEFQIKTGEKSSTCSSPLSVVSILWLLLFFFFNVRRGCYPLALPSHPHLPVKERLLLTGLSSGDFLNVPFSSGHSFGSLCSWGLRQTRFSKDGLNKISSIHFSCPVTHTPPPPPISHQEEVFPLPLNLGGPLECFSRQHREGDAM